MPRVSAWGVFTPATELRKKCKVASIQRQTVEGVLVDDLSDRRFIRLQLRWRSGDLDSLRGGAQTQLDVDEQVLPDGHSQVLLGGCRESRGGHGDGVMADSDRREDIFAGAARGGLKGYALIGVQEGHVCVGHRGARGVLNHSVDDACIHLAEEMLRLGQHDQACKGYIGDTSEPLGNVAINGHKVTSLPR